MGYYRHVCTARGHYYTTDQTDMFTDKDQSEIMRRVGLHVGLCIEDSGLS